MTRNQNPPSNFPEVAVELGEAALQQTIHHAESACQHEKQRRELNNQMEITECKARLKIRSDERDDLRATLRRTVQTVEDSRHRRGYYIACRGYFVFRRVFFCSPCA